jgi:hypothetical protein
MILCLVALLALAVAPDAGAFRIAADQVRGVGVYTAIEPAPASPSLDVRDPAAIAALLAGIDFEEQADCGPFGAAAEAVVYLEFADGAVERYEVLAGYEHLAKPGLPGACHALTDAAGEQLRTMTRVTPCGETFPVCNGSCAVGFTCAAFGICVAGPNLGLSCFASDPGACLGFPCIPVLCGCMAE